MTRPQPVPHLFLEDGGMVTRCSDVHQARRLLVEHWLEDRVGVFLDDLPATDPEDRAAERREVAEASGLFRPHVAQVRRGRVIPAGPDHIDGYSWFWLPLPDDAHGPGVTTAVVWS